MPNPSTEREPVITDATKQAELIKQFTFQIREPTGDLASINNIQYDLTLVLNPQSLVRTQAAKNAVTETQTGQWIDSMGLAAPEWRIQGNFGYKKKFKPNSTEETDGYQSFREFEELVRVYFRTNRERILESTGEVQLVQMWFLDWEDEDFFVIEPMGLPEKSRNSQQPLFRDYTFQFRGVLDLLRDGPQRDRDEIVDNVEDRQTRMAKTEESMAAQQTRLTGEATHGDTDAITEKAEETGSATDLASNASTEGWDQEVVNTINDVNDFITEKGDTFDEVVDSTIGAVQRIVEAVDNTLESLESNIRAADPRFLTADLIDTFRQVRCGLTTILSFPEAFSEDYQKALDSLRALFFTSGCASTMGVSDPELR